MTSFNPEDAMHILSKICVTYEQTKWKPGEKEALVGNTAMQKLC